MNWEAFGVGVNSGLVGLLREDGDEALAGVAEIEEAGEI